MSQPRGRAWAPPGSQLLPHTMLGSQAVTRTPLGWRAPATQRASPLPSTQTAPSSWAHARSASFAPSSSPPARPPAPFQAPPNAAASVAAAAVAFRDDERADALRVAVERVAKDVARAATEAAGERAATEKALAEVGGEVDRLARVVEGCVKEEGRRGREAGKATAAVHAAEAQEMRREMRREMLEMCGEARAMREEMMAMREEMREEMRGVIKEVAAVVASRKAEGGPRAEEDGRRSRYTQKGRVDAFHSCGRVQQGGYCEDNAFGGDVACAPGGVKLAETLPPPSADLRLGMPARRAPRSLPAALPAFAAGAMAPDLPPMHPRRRDGVGHAVAWPPEAEYRMPVPVGTGGGHGGEEGDREDFCDAEEKEKEEEDDVFQDDGPLDRQRDAVCSDSDDGTVAPWEIGVGDVVPDAPPPARMLSPVPELRKPHVTREGGRAIYKRRSRRRRS